MPVLLSFAYCREHKAIVRIANSHTSNNDYPLVQMNMLNANHPHARFPATKGAIKTLSSKSWQPALLIDILTTLQGMSSMSYLLLMVCKQVQQRVWGLKEHNLLNSLDFCRTKSSVQ